MKHRYRFACDIGMAFHNPLSTSRDRYFLPHDSAVRSHFLTRACCLRLTATHTAKCQGAVIHVCDGETDSYPVSARRTRLQRLARPPGAARPWRWAGMAMWSVRSIGSTSTSLPPTSTGSFEPMRGHAYRNRSIGFGMSAFEQDVLGRSPSGHGRLSTLSRFDRTAGVRRTAAVEMPAPHDGPTRRQPALVPMRVVRTHLATCARARPRANGELRIPPPLGIMDCWGDRVARLRAARHRRQLPVNLQNV